MKLETRRQGRFLARRALFKLAKAGPEACRANQIEQAGALRTSLEKLITASQAAREGFSQVLTDALGVRQFCDARELAMFYERMEAEGRFSQPMGRWQREPDARQGRAGTLTSARDRTDERGRFARLT